jgi:hypothetical protein
VLAAYRDAIAARQGLTMGESLHAGSVQAPSEML